MNYVRFKKRILLTWTYNFLLIKADIEDEGKVYVSMFCINGVYVACIVGSNTEIETIIKTLESKHLTSNVYGLSIFDIKASLDNSENFISDISVVSDFEMNTVLDESKAIPLEELSSLLNIEVKESIAVSKPLKADIESFCEVLAEIYVPPPIKEMSVNVELDFNFIVKGNMADSRLITVNIPYSSSLSSNMNTSTPIDFSSKITDTLSLTVLMDGGIPISILSFSSGQVVLNMQSILKTSKAFKSNISQNGMVSVIIRLIEGALLSDYDLLSLSDLDNLTLYKLDYINE